MVRKETIISVCDVIVGFFFKGFGFFLNLRGFWFVMVLILEVE